MSKKQTKGDITITQSDLEDIKHALDRITWMQEAALCSPTPSDGYLFIASDMAEYVAKKLGLELEIG